MNKPVITISAIRPGSVTKDKEGKEIQNMSVELRKKVEATTEQNLMSLAFLRKGDSRIINNGPKELVFTLNNVTQESCDAYGFAEGVDVNTLGHGVVYDIRETYRTELSTDTQYSVGSAKAMRRNDLDPQGNLQVEPMINPTNGEILLSEGKLIFRQTELLMAPKVEDLPQSEPKRVYDKDEFGNQKTVAGFEGVAKIPDATGRNRKTPEYQAFLNSLYSQFNKPGVTIQVAPELAVAA